IWRNARDGEPDSDAPIPRHTIEKPPSAELRPDQYDTDSLPPYDVLDPILERYVEQDWSIPEIIAEGHDPDLVRRVARLADVREYKRRQSPPGVRITQRAFGKDRRVPITSRVRNEELILCRGGRVRLLQGFSATEGAESTESCRRGECAALALPHPSTLQSALFVCDPDSKTGVPERTKAAAMKHDRRPEQNRDG